jgi:hypothetical protein
MFAEHGEGSFKAFCLDRLVGIEHATRFSLIGVSYRSNLDFHSKCGFPWAFGILPICGKTHSFPAGGRVTCSLINDSQSTGESRDG